MMRIQEIKSVCVGGGGDLSWLRSALRLRVLKWLRKFLIISPFSFRKLYNTVIKKTVIKLTFRVIFSVLKKYVYMQNYAAVYKFKGGIPLLPVEYIMKEL